MTELETGQAIRLYDYWRSSSAYRVRIGLNLAGLGWDAVPVNLVEGKQSTPDYLALNPQGLVPALEIDGHRLTQSLAILEYLDETRQLGLLPEDPHERALARAISYAIAMEIHPVCNLRVAKRVVAVSGGAMTMEGWMQAIIAPGLAAVEMMVEDGLYCTGGRLTLADICLVPQIYNARRWGVDMTPLPKLVRIDAHLAKLPAFVSAFPAQ